MTVVALPRKKPLDSSAHEAHTDLSSEGQSPHHNVSEGDSDPAAEPDGR